MSGKVTNPALRLHLDRAGRFFKDFRQIKEDSNTPWTHGCALGAGTNWTVPLNRGKYLLMVMPDSPFVVGSNGFFVANCKCTNGAQSTIPEGDDPASLGWSVDQRTGAVTGTPTREGAGYKMKLQAFDGSTSQVCTRHKVLSRLRCKPHCTKLHRNLKCSQRV